MRRIILIGILLLTTIAAEAAVKYDAKREKAYRARVAKFVAAQTRKQQFASKTQFASKANRPSKARAQD